MLARKSDSLDSNPGCATYVPVSQVPVLSDCNVFMITVKIIIATTEVCSDNICKAFRMVSGRY